MIFCNVILLNAQGVEIPVSAANPYGIDFSKLQGNISQITEYRGEKFDDLKKYSMQVYDIGKITSSTIFENNGSVRSVTKYEYNKSGRLESIKGNDDSENITWSYQYTYDNYGRQVEEKSLSSDDNAEGKITSRYNENGSDRKSVV